jgi:HAD superfamily hydrolase (TIGR01450 family)
MIRAVALDLDGVVYEGDSIIEGVAATISGLAKKGIAVYFATNNSGKKRASIATKLGKMGIEVALDRVITSGYVAALLVDGLCQTEGNRILVIGSEELEEELAQFNQKVVHAPPAEILVVGYDRAFSYEKLFSGLNALRQGAVFVACNRDRVFPAGDNQVLPACGPIVAAMEWAWGKSADYVAGKPNTLMLKLIARSQGLMPHEILVVGDTMDSDIAMARAFGSPSVLVSEKLTDDRTEMAPNYRISSLNHLPRVLAKL